MQKMAHIRNIIRITNKNVVQCHKILSFYVSDCNAVQRYGSSFLDTDQKIQCVCIIDKKETHDIYLTKKWLNKLATYPRAHKGILVGFHWGHVGGWWALNEIDCFNETQIITRYKTFRYIS